MPKLETLNSLGCMSSMNLVLTKQGLLHMELLLLETFQWNLYLPTAAHFIEYCLSIAVYEGDLHDGWPIGCLEKTVSYMAKYADYFLEVSLQGKGSISWDLCLCDYIYTYTHIHTITERFSERTKIKNVLKLTKTQLKSLWLLCPPPQITRSCVLPHRWWLQGVWLPPASSSACRPPGLSACCASLHSPGRALSPAWRSYSCESTKHVFNTVV